MIDYLQNQYYSVDNCELGFEVVHNLKNCIFLIRRIMKSLGGFFIRRKLDKKTGKKDVVYRSILHIVSLCMKGSLRYWCCELHFNTYH